MKRPSNEPAGPYCVIPAAGRSSRMAAWKPVLPWKGTTVCGAVVDAALEAGLRPLVVAGYRSGELTALFAGRPEVTLVVNGEWERGMLGSVRVGARRVVELLRDSGEGYPNGFLVAPADMPRLPVAAFRAIAAEAESLGEPSEDSGPRAVFASMGGRLGHPVWIPGGSIPGLEGLDPGSRLRDYLLGGPWSSVEIDDDGIFADLDTPEAYAAALDAAARDP